MNKVNTGKSDKIKKRRFLKSRKIKIAKIITFTVVGVGLLFLLYPFFTNVIAGVKEANILSEWEAQKLTLSEEGSESAGLAESSEITSIDTLDEENNKSDGVIEKPGNSKVNVDKVNEEILNYENLTAEDFFPLKIQIPKIDLQWIVNEGSDRQTLKEGPGHIIETPLPGDIGRCTFSGHRTTYGAPFNRIDELVEGDLIYLETIKSKVLVYAVTKVEIVDPKDVYILEGSGKKELLLTSCYPEYSAVERIILISELVSIYPLGLEF